MIFLNIFENKKSSKFCFFFLFILNFFVFCFICISCKSINNVKNIPQPIDYDDSNVVQNEIQRINSFMESEPVRALWRAILLDDEKMIFKTKENLWNLYKNAIDEKNYYEAMKYLKSLETSGFSDSQKLSSEKSISENKSFEELSKLFLQEVPGLQSDSEKKPKTIADCMDATVTIWVDRGIKVQNGSGYADIVIGSGFFIDRRGYLVTNHHVIDSMVNPKYEGFSRLYIKLLEDSDTKIPAKVIGYDSVLDLALLKVEVEPKFVLELGTSADLKIGDKVSAIGTPIGLEGTLTSGIISSTERKLMTLGNVFQLDAAVNSGNSGGPLIDENLKVQAIVFAGMLQFQGLNFAIPVEYLRQELSLMYNRSEVVHSWIGCYGHTKRNGKQKVGLEIQYVLPGSPAFLAGLKEGDVITSFDGKKVLSLEDFQFICMGYEPETLLSFSYVTGYSDENLSEDGNDELTEKKGYLYLDKRPKEPGHEIFKTDFIQNGFIPLFGMKMIPASTLNKNSYTIEKVIKGSAADELNFSKFDAVTVRDMKIDMENEYIFVQIYSKRKKKGFLDITMVLSAPFDNPYYF